MVKPSDVLMNISCIVKYNPDMWTQGSCGKNYRDGSCSVYSQEAVKFCSLGFLTPYSDAVVDTAVGYLEKIINTDIISWNDNQKRTAKEVSVAFEKAAKLAEANGH